MGISLQRRGGGGRHERGRVGANVERIHEQEWDGRCAGDLERYERDCHRGGKRHRGRHCTRREEGSRRDGNVARRRVAAHISDVRAELAVKRRWC